MAQLLDMDDDNLLAQLQFMQKADGKEDLYYWPAADDIIIMGKLFTNSCCP